MRSVQLRPSEGHTFGMCASQGTVQFASHAILLPRFLFIITNSKLIVYVVQQYKSVSKRAGPDMPNICRDSMQAPNLHASC